MDISNNFTNLVELISASKAPVLLLNEILHTNPEALTDENVLTTLLHKLSISDIINIIANNPYIYDKVSSKSQYWNHYYNFLHPNNQRTINGVFEPFYACFEHNTYYVLDAPPTADMYKQKLNRDYIPSTIFTPIIDYMNKNSLILGKLKVDDVKRIILEGNTASILYKDKKLYYLYHTYEPILVYSDVKEILGIVVYYNDETLLFTAILQGGTIVFMYTYRSLKLKLFIDMNFLKDKYKLDMIINIKNDANDDDTIIIEFADHSLYVINSSLLNVFDQEISVSIQNPSQFMEIEKYIDQEKFTDDNFRLIRPGINIDKEKELTHVDLYYNSPSLISDTYSIDTINYTITYFPDSSGLSTGRLSNFNSNSDEQYSYLSKHLYLHLQIYEPYPEDDDNTGGSYSTIDVYDINEFNSRLTDLNIVNVYWYREFSSDDIKVVIEHEEQIPILHDNGNNDSTVEMINDDSPKFITVLKRSSISIADKLDNNNIIIDSELRPVVFSSEYDVEKIKPINYSSSASFIIDDQKDVYLKTTTTIRDYLRYTTPTNTNTNKDLFISVENFMYANYDYIIDILRRKGITFPTGKDNYTKLLSNAVELIPYGSSYIVNVKSNSEISVPYFHLLAYSSSNSILKEKRIGNEMIFTVKQYPTYEFTCVIPDGS